MTRRNPNGGAADGRTGTGADRDFWYDPDTHRFIGPVGWALLLDEQPVRGLAIISPKGKKTDVYGRTTDLGEQILVESAAATEEVTFALNDAHNHASKHRTTNLGDLLQNGSNADFERSMASRHAGEATVTNLETARAAPNPDDRFDQFDRAFALRLYMGKHYALNPDASPEAWVGTD